MVLSPSTCYLLFSISHFVLAAVYVVLFILSVILLLQLPRKKDGSRQQPQALFFAFLIIGSIVRICWCIFSGLMKSPNQGFQLPWSINFFLNTLPSFLFFTAFLVILSLWAELYHSANNRLEFKLLRLKNPLLILNVILYCFLGTWWAIDFLCATPWGNGFHAAPPSGMASNSELVVLFSIEVMFIGSLVGFLVYGFLIYRKLARLQYKMPKGSSVLQRIALITGLNAVCFALRAGVVIWGDITSRGQYNSPNFWWVDICYFIVLEIVPLCMLMLLLRKNERKELAAVNPSTNVPSTPPSPGARDPFAPTYSSISSASDSQPLLAQ